MVARVAKVAKSRWSQHYRERAPCGLPTEVVENAVATAEKTRNDDGSRTPIFTLKHLSNYTGVSVQLLRSLVQREEPVDYKVFLLAKGAGRKGNRRGYRVIAVPRLELKAVQRWICDHILNHQRVHPAGTAYRPESNLLDAVKPHLGCKWLIKLDLQAFFDSVSEISVYKVFRRIGYQPLVAFELSRLCTRLGRETAWRRHHRWQSHHRSRYSIVNYTNRRIGHLPQGAPTSPMLSNLVMLAFDASMSALAHKRGFVYSRYADDLAFSTRSNASRDQCASLVREAYGQIGRHGLAPNLSKTKIAPPGARKLLLGLLIDGDEARLTKDLRKRLGTHIHYLKRFGPVEHAERRGFESVFGLRNYLMGLAHYARQVDPPYGTEVLRELRQVSWPI